MVQRLGRQLLLRRLGSRAGRQNGEGLGTSARLNGVWPGKDAPGWAERREVETA